MAAGDTLTQSRLDAEISSRVRQMARLKFEVAQLKSVTDGLTQAAGLALPLGGRAASWDATDWANLTSSLADLNTSLQGWPTVFAARVWGIGS